MLEDIKELKEKGCSKEFISIVEKYTESDALLMDIDKFIQEIVDYKSDEEIHPFEEDLLDAAIKMSMTLDNRPLIVSDDSTEVAIRKIEMDYNGDALSTGGYALY